MRTIYFLLLLLPGITIAQKDWKLAKNNNDIQIWVRDYQDSHLKEYKASTYIDTSLQNVVDELLLAPQYIENCAEGVSHLVKQEKALIIFTYETNFPGL